MPKEKVNNLLGDISNYLTSQNRIEPFLFLYGEDKIDGTKKVLDLALNSATDISEINKILSKFVNNATRYVEGDESFKDIEENEDLVGLFYKSMGNEDFLKTNDLSVIPSGRNPLTILDFAKGKFKNQFLVLELNLDGTGNKKVLLMKAISPSYYARSKFSISWYDERKKIQFIDNKKNLIFNEYFDIVTLIDNQSQVEGVWRNENANSFFFIINRKKFEDLYDYLEKYDDVFKCAFKNKQETLLLL